jgi:hypothetical protein
VWRRLAGAVVESGTHATLVPRQHGRACKVRQGQNRAIWELDCDRRMHLHISVGPMLAFAMVLLELRGEPITPHGRGGGGALPHVTLVPGSVTAPRARPHEPPVIPDGSFCF